jgi:hypothetical protein
MKTKICITIDTEFSIGGAFRNPEIYRPVSEQAVFCSINGKSNGLGFILETLDRFNIEATFFTEAINTYYFGEEPLRKVCDPIRNAGQDIQLHIHPVWEYFSDKDWVSRLGVDPPNDSICERTTAQIVDLIRYGIDSFKKIGVDKPIALRTGNLHVKPEVYSAMRQCGLYLASNVCMGIAAPNVGKLQLFGGRHWIGEVLEVPVSTYQDIKVGKFNHYKGLTITGSSWGEIKSILQTAHSEGVQTIVILTHPSEFVKTKDVQYNTLAPNRTTQQRLIKLCQFIKEHSDKYDAVSFSSASKCWKNQPGEASPVLKVNAVKSGFRILQNKLIDWNLHY